MSNLGTNRIGKKISIESCTECPYLRHGMLRDHVCCLAAEPEYCGDIKCKFRWFQSGDGFPIPPAWCPLEDDR
jgi:hypothetical protein